MTEHTFVKCECGVEINVSTHKIKHVIPTIVVCPNCQEVLDEYGWKIAEIDELEYEIEAILQQFEEEIEARKELSGFYDPDPQQVKRKVRKLDDDA